MAPASPVPPVEFESPELHILAVDDTPANLVALERVLQGLPAKLVRCSSGEEALAASLHHRFALAILDVQMPEMDGYELAEILLADPATCRTPIIFMTAASYDESHVFRGYTAGAVAYFIKPYHPDTLLSKVRVFLELAVQRQQLELMLAERNRALDASEGRFDDLFEIAPQALLMITPAGVIQRSNAAAESLFGYPPGELEGLALARASASAATPGRPSDLTAARCRWKCVRRWLKSPGSPMCWPAWATSASESARLKPSSARCGKRKSC